MSRAKQIGYLGEKRVSDYLGFKRYGATGKDNTDLHSQDNQILVEVKSGAQVPKLLIKALSQVVNDAEQRNNNPTPVVVMVPKGVGEAKLGDEALAILRLKDLKALFDEQNIRTVIPDKLDVSIDDSVYTYTIES